MMCLGIRIPRALTSDAASQLIDEHKSTEHLEPPNQIQTGLARAWGIPISKDDTRDSAGWALWQAYSENPEVPIPRNLQKLIFGRYLEGRGCFFKITTFAFFLFTIFILICWLLL